MHPEHHDHGLAASSTALMADAGAGAVVLFIGWAWLDPAISLVIVAIVVVGTWGLLRASLHLALHAVPPAHRHRRHRSLPHRAAGRERHP